MDRIFDYIVTPLFIVCVMAAVLSLAAIVGVVFFGFQPFDFIVRLTGGFS